MGPFWSWNEVWLISTGGVLAIAFPKVLATAFSGFYVAMIILVWCILLRGISIEFAGHVVDRMWRSFWDFVFVMSNVLLAILFGAAFGNLVRGVPLDPGRPFSLPLFTDFRTTGPLGILDWYTTLVALFALITLAAHGATYLVARTEGVVRDRSARLAGRLWIAVFAALPLLTLATWRVRPELAGGLIGRPLGWLAVVLAVAGGSAVFSGLRGTGEGRALLGVVRRDHRALGRRSGERLPGDAALDPRARALDHRPSTEGRRRTALLWASSGGRWRSSSP